MGRDIDEIIERVKQRIPDVKVRQYWVPNPSQADDGIWFFRLPEIAKSIQIESTYGMCPFMVEHDDMKATSEALTARTVEEAVEMVTVYLMSLRSGSQPTKS